MALKRAKYFTFPFPDIDVRDYLLRRAGHHGELFTYEHARLSFFHLLNAIFQVVVEALSAFGNPDEPFDPKAWRNYLGDADEKKLEVPESVRSTLYRKAVWRAGAAQGLPMLSGTDLGNAVKYIEQETLLSARKLQEKLRSRFKQPTPQEDVLSNHILLYFDESHTLYDKRVLDQGKTFYDAFANCLEALGSENVLVVFLSTKSHLTKFAAPRGRHASGRVNEGSGNLPAPFTELPFDCPWRNELIVSLDPITLAHIRLIEFLAKFGRPMWYSRYLHGSVRFVRPKLVSFAQSKLIASEAPPKTGRLSEDQTLAVLSVRLLLNFEPPRTVVLDKEAAQVENHMRIAYSVPGHREYMRSGYPSEPILAEAAAQLMKCIPSVPTALASFINNGLVEKGQAGELVARLLLTLAYDRVIVNAPKKITEAPYSQGCLLIDFLTELSGKGNYDKLSICKPDNLPDQTTASFGEAFKDAVVRFTHFGRAADANVVNTTFAWASFLRCMGIQCSPNQASFDLIIPVLLNQNADVCPANMTALLISVKDKYAAGNPSVLNFKAPLLGFLTEEPPRPYLNILMQLGVSKAPSFRVIPIGCNFKSTSIHSRYTIDSRGCTPSLYPVIDKFQDIYSALLLSQDMLREHPRQDKRFLTAVQKLEPVWTNEILNSWIESKHLTQFFKEWEV